MSAESSSVDRVPRRDLERLFRVGLALGSERDASCLSERILLEAKALADADGGTLYLRNDEEQLVFAILRNDSLGIALGGSTGQPVELPAVPLYDPLTGEENHAHVVSHAVHVGRPVHVADAYEADGFDFGGTKSFDAANGYRSTSLLTLPMKNQEGRVIGVLQLINARSPTGAVVAFEERHLRVAEALAAQAAVALDAQQLYEGQRRLLEAFLELLATAIDHKSPYTGGHCRRVPLLTEMIVEAMAASEDGIYRDFDLSEEEWYELHIAGWLHDCGKVTTPVHVMDKATKLEGIIDGLEVVRARVGTLMAQTELAAREAGEAPEPALAALREDLDFLERANTGGETMSLEDQARVRRIAGHVYHDVGGRARPLLEPDEVDKLCVTRGTLTEEERRIINGHMVQTVQMLEALPFPRNLRRVPEYACGHHERMSGEGYPRGIFAGDMSLPARAMAIADVFEALTAADRPYKKAMPLSRSMAIMGQMKVNNHLDPDLFDFFVRSGVYRRYAEKFLPAELCDEVDEIALLALEPKTFRVPPKEERDRRWRGFLPEYQAMVRDHVPGLSVVAPNGGSRGAASASRSDARSTGSDRG